MGAFSKRPLLAIMVIVMAAAIGVALVGCDSEEAAQKAFLGTWDLTSMSEEGREASAEDIAYLGTVGMESSLTLSSDGSASLVVFGEEADGQWSASSTVEASAELQGREAALKIEGEALFLTYDDSDIEMTFQKSGE